MAEFFTNYPQAQKPMSLGEMLNIAGGVQQYQQAQQMNPLALKKAQMEIEQAQQVNPLKVRQEQAATQPVQATPYLLALVVALVIVLAASAFIRKKRK